MIDSFSFGPNFFNQNLNNEQGPTYLTTNQVMYDQNTTLQNSGDTFPYDMHFDPTSGDNLLFRPEVVQDDFHLSTDEALARSLETYFELDKHILGL